MKIKHKQEIIMKEQYTHEILQIFNLKENQNLTNNQRFLKVYDVVNRLANDSIFIGRNQVKREVKKFAATIQSQGENNAKSTHKNK